jgi:hypothetical protein
MVERFNRTFTEALSKIVGDERDWDLLAPIVCMYYRASIHKATGCSPALLMLGRELRLPLDILYPISQPNPEGDPRNYVQQVEERLEKASAYARTHLEVSWEQRAAATKSTGRVVPIDSNRPVYVFNPAVPKGKTPKLARMWRGPYPVLEKISDYLYRVRMGGRSTTRVVHRYHLFQPKVGEIDRQ